jgi:hypothetical protein
MKYIAEFNKYKKIIVTETDLENINKLLINKFEENNINPNIDAIYSELELIKKDTNNSFLFYIIKSYFQMLSRQDIIHTAIKFFDNKYGDVIKKYKQDQKKEFDVDTEKEGNFVLLPYNDQIVKVPIRIGHNYKPIKILPIEELHTKFTRHKRLKVFHHKGLKCINCEREGEYLIAAKDNGGNIHIDLYTKDFVLMTIDHIKPKSKGGSYDIENLNPMCTYCNSKKSDTWNEEDVILETIELEW